MIFLWIRTVGKIRRLRRWKWNPVGASLLLIVAVARNWLREVLMGILSSMMG